MWITPAARPARRALAPRKTRARRPDADTTRRSARAARSAEETAPGDAMPRLVLRPDGPTTVLGNRAQQQKDAVTGSRHRIMSARAACDSSGLGSVDPREEADGRSRPASRLGAGSAETGRHPARAAGGHTQHRGGDGRPPPRRGAQGPRAAARTASTLAKRPTKRSRPASHPGADGAKTDRHPARAAVRAYATPVRR